MSKHPFNRLLFSVLTVLVAQFTSVASLAQPCQNAQVLCADNPDGDTDIDTPAPVNFGCFSALNTVFYSFTANNNSSGVGDATIEIVDINCPGLSGAEEVQAMVVQVVDPLLDPCDPSNWLDVTGCFEDSIAISITTPELVTSGDYFLLLGTNQDPATLDCNLDVFISGPGVDINACCDAEISQGESAQFSVIGGDVPPGYTWSPVTWLDNFTSQTPTSFPEETTTYTATGFINGCQVTDQVTVFVTLPITPTNAITPNGDGFNDTWTINGIARFPLATVNVFNRWGQNVFTSTGYAQPWDGTHDGNRLPTATYYFVIELNSQDVAIEPISGFVTVIH